MPSWLFAGLALAGSAFGLRQLLGWVDFCFFFLSGWFWAGLVFAGWLWADSALIELSWLYVGLALGLIGFCWVAMDWVGLALDWVGYRLLAFHWVVFFLVWLS